MSEETHMRAQYKQFVLWLMVKYQDPETVIEFLISTWDEIAQEIMVELEPPKPKLRLITGGQSKTT